MKQTIVVRNILKEKREAMQMSKRDLADLVGSTVATIDAIEKGKYIPSIYLSLLICLALEESVESVFGLEFSEQRSNV